MRRKRRNYLPGFKAKVALVDALQTHGTPAIFNTDQEGCQFTREGFTDLLKAHGIQISMDCKGRWMDNVFVERLLWRSLKYEEVYLKACDTVAQATQGIWDWMDFYNQYRHHASLNRMTPDQVYYGMPCHAIGTSHGSIKQHRDEYL